MIDIVLRKLKVEASSKIEIMNNFKIAHILKFSINKEKTI